jgi:hypothetical protein
MVPFAFSGLAVIAADHNLTGLYDFMLDGGMGKEVDVLVPTTMRKYFL